MTTANRASAGTQSYGYNHANQRVFVRNGNTVTYYLYGLGGERLMEFQETCTGGACTSYTETQRWIYFAGRKMFQKTGTTLKAITPNRLASEAKHFPYGETDGTPPSDTKDYFATYRRDPTGLDYAWNRYYSPTMGRFTTADPYGRSARLQNPQTWNRYSYAWNNPANSVDADGLSPYQVDCSLNGCLMAPPEDGGGIMMVVKGYQPSADIVEFELAYAEGIKNLRDAMLANAAFQAGDFATAASLIRANPSLYFASSSSENGSSSEIGDALPYLLSLAGHVGLDIAGMIPEIGEAADLVNTAWYAAEGQETDAALSFAGAALPLGGQLATFVRSARVFRAIGRLLAGWRIGMDIHHAFPKSMADVFMDRFNINVWDPSNAALWDWRPHRANAHAYNQAWSQWLVENPAATADDATAFATKLMTQFGLTWP